MLYDVTLPGHQVPPHSCPQIGCEKPFKGHFTEKDIAAWELALQQGPEAVQTYLESSGARAVRHVDECPFRYLPPAVLALCSEKQLMAQHDKVWAVLRRY
jgi:hypothetical protein